MAQQKLTELYEKMESFDSKLLLNIQKNSTILLKIIFGNLVSFYIASRPFNTLHLSPTDGNAL